MSYAQGEHNERLCDHLLSNGNWNDWVVTTAYYAAIHFVDVLLFPHDEDGSAFANIDEFFSSLPDWKKRQGKHAARIELVGKKLRMARSALLALKEKCHSARYYNFRTTPEDSRDARTKLKLVKMECVSAARKNGVEFGPPQDTQSV